MNYTFKMKDNSTLRVFWNNLFEDKVNKTHGVVSWCENTENGGHKEIKRTVRIDDNGRKFFTWNREKIYMDEFLAYTPCQLVENFKKSRVLPEDLCHTLLRYGMDSVRVRERVKPLERVNFGGVSIGFEVSSPMDKLEDKDWVDYTFVEEYLHTPDSCYKLKVTPLKEEYRGVYPSRSYYVGDLIGLITECTDEFGVCIGNYSNSIKHFMYDKGEFQ